MYPSCSLVVRIHLSPHFICTGAPFCISKPSLLSPFTSYVYLTLRYRLYPTLFSGLTRISTSTVSFPLTSSAIVFDVPTRPAHRPGRGDTFLTCSSTEAYVHRYVPSIDRALPTSPTRRSGGSSSKYCKRHRARTKGTMTSRRPHLFALHATLHTHDMHPVLSLTRPREHDKYREAWYSAYRLLLLPPRCLCSPSRLRLQDRTECRSAARLRSQIGRAHV